MIVPRATSFMPTLSIALSKALPIKNSRERSTSVSEGYLGALGRKSYSKPVSDLQMSAAAASYSIR